MSGPDKRAREEKEAAASGARAARAARRAARGAVYEAGAAEPGARETPATLLDVAWIVAKNGYAANVWRCCGICREMWRWIAPELSEEDAARVRRDHPFWQAIINLPYGEEGNTRLILVAWRGKLADVETLIAWHADVNAAANDGWTALIYASVCGNVDAVIVRALLAAGADVDAANSDGLTALNWAFIKGHIEIVRALLAASADVNAAANDGWTPLIRASYYGYVTVVRALLAAGASKHPVGIDGSTAYSVASTAAIRALLNLAP